MDPEEPVMDAEEPDRPQDQAPAPEPDAAEGAAKVADRDHLGDHQHEGVLERTEDRLAGLDDAPVDEHLVIYDAVLRDLGDALTGASDHQD